MTTGQRMKERRKEIGMSAEQLGDILCVSPATIYRYENGDIEKVPGDRLAIIAKALNISPMYLMGWEEKTPEEPQLDEGERLLIQLFRQVPPDRQKLILDTVRAFADQL